MTIDLRIPGRRGVLESWIVRNLGDPDTGELPEASDPGLCLYEINRMVDPVEPIHITHRRADGRLRLLAAVATALADAEDEGCPLFTDPIGMMRAEELADKVDRIERAGALSRGSRRNQAG